MTPEEALRWCYRHQIRLEFERRGAWDMLTATVPLRAPDGAYGVMSTQLRHHETVPDAVGTLCEAARLKYCLE